METILSANLIPILASLFQDNWLSDQTIDAAIATLHPRVAARQDPTRHLTFTCDAIARFQQYIATGDSFQDIAHILLGLDIFDYDTMTFPVEYPDGHRALIIVSLRDKTITYYDGQARDGSIYLKFILNLLDATLHVHPTPPTTSSIPFRIIIAPVPQQHRNLDTGLFVIINAECAILKYDATPVLSEFSHAASTFHRRRLALLLAPPPLPTPASPLFQLPRRTARPKRSIPRIFDHRSSFSSLLDEVDEQQSSSSSTTFPSAFPSCQVKRKATVEPNIALSDPEDPPANKRKKRSNGSKRTRSPSPPPSPAAPEPSACSRQRKRRVIIDEDDSSLSPLPPRTSKTKRIEDSSAEDSPQAKRPRAPHGTDDPG
jgi:hypothetical protein